MGYLAHIAEDGREQTVLEHLEGTAALCAAFAASFGAAEQGRLAGLAHDIGKYSAAFQRRLRGSPEQVDHSTAGAAECFRLGQPFAAFAVAGHHGGLPDGGGQGDPPGEPTFFGRMNRAKSGKLEPCGGWREDLTSLPSPGLPAFAGEQAAGMFFTRMLYSCLVDADFLDTEAFMAGQPREQGGGPGMGQLLDRLQAYVSGWYPPKGALNRQRCAILDRCLSEGRARSRGLFTLTVPTGGGKTVSSLAFALSHARAQGLRRVVYVIPYTSIIEQTAQVFRDILGEENVLEHHSGLLYDVREEADPRSVRLARATENWDIPVVVTTAVQFFESLFAARSSQCRKLHSLAGSAVVFDEAQMLPLPYLRPCVWAIAQLVERFSVSAVLCTATQPALENLFRKFLPGRPAVELCPPEHCRWEDFRRVSFQNAGRLAWQELAERLNGHAQVLCVVNTRKSAQAVFRLLDGEGSFHLSTLMFPAHRRAQLKEIRRRLAGGLPCRVVSTSLIEAGVDVDFPTVYREEAGLDSILQAAGRCNREGKRPAAESMVTIFQGEGQTPPLFAAAVGAGRQVMARHGDIASQAAVHDYFHQLLDLSGEEAQDARQILRTIREEVFPFRTVAERFHLIDSPTRTVYIPLGKGAGLADRLRAGERSRELFRLAGQYGVSVYDRHFDALARAGALEPLEDGSAILAAPALYAEKTGLPLEADAGQALFV